MSGNLWMFSDKLDDEDIEIMKHEFITYYQGADYYGLGLKMFTRLAHEAGAVYKIGKKVLIRRKGQSRWEAASKNTRHGSYVNRVLAYACMVRVHSQGQKF